MIRIERISNKEFVEERLCLERAFPREFQGTEYEVKFNIIPLSKGDELSIDKYIEALDFPLDRKARFLRYSISPVTNSVNHYIGDDFNERFVIMEDEGKIFFKEKGEILPVKVGIKLEDMVTKRKEKAYETSVEEIIKKILNKAKENSASCELKYLGKIRKEKGDIYVLDANDGRVYSLTTSISYLNDNTNKAIQRQLEIEYYGYLPEFKNFKKNSEKQLIQGLTELAKFTYDRFNGKTIAKGGRIILEPTKERKYDFVIQNINYGGGKIVPIGTNTCEERRETI